MNSQKKKEAYIQQSRLNKLVNKGFIWLSWKLFLRDMAGSPERAR